MGESDSGPGTSGEAEPAPKRRRARAARLNSIAPVRTVEAPSAAQPSPTASPGPEVRSDRAADSGAPPDGKRDRLSGAVPAAVRERLLRVGRDYFFPDGAPAFTDHGTRLTTRSENTELVRQLVEIAALRGWDAVQVAGTARFRQLAWQAGVSAGLAVRGYRASAVETARLERQERRSAGTPQEEVASAPPAPDRDSAIAATRPAEPRVPLVQGQLLAHGRAPYQFREGEQISYYVRIRTKEGERTLWGKDLERALAEAKTHPRVGDPVGLQPTGREPVSVRVPERQAEGSAGERQKNAHRNRWVLERLELFESRAGAAATLRNAALSPSEGIQRHPELADAYLHVRAAEDLASRRIALPADRERFVSLVREALAAAAARGEDIPAARLRERAEVRNSRRELEHELTR